MTIALACISRAFLTMRPTACRRASSRSWVYSVISPPTMDRRPAMMLPPNPRLRTTTPNTCPLTSLTRYPATFSVVTTSMIHPRASGGSYYVENEEIACESVRRTTEYQRLRDHPRVSVARRDRADQRGGGSDL